MRDFIAAQQVNSTISLMLGGGTLWFKDKVLEYANERGYNIIFNSTNLNSSTLPLLGLFAPDAVAYEIDRVEFPGQPSLIEMTQKALDLLSKNSEKGFFLMIEGSKIDWAEHSNDPMGVYSEAQQFALAFQSAIDYAKKSKDTLVIATADHETGGMSLGYQPYGQPGGQGYFWYPEVIAKVTRTSEFIGDVLEAAPNDTLSIVSLFQNYTSIILNPEETAELMSAKAGDYDLWYAVGRIISRRARIGWTSTVHTGVDVNIYGYGPSVEYFCGNRDNTDFAHSIIKIFNWDVDSITAELRKFNTSG